MQSNDEITNQFDLYLNTSLCMTVNQNEIERIKSVLNKGTNSNYIDQDGNTPLEVAVQCASKWVINILLTNGAISSFKNTIEMIASENFASIGDSIIKHRNLIDNFNDTGELLIDLTSQYYAQKLSKNMMEKLRGLGSVEPKSVGSLIETSDTPYQIVKSLDSLLGSTGVNPNCDIS